MEMSIKSQIQAIQQHISNCLKKEESIDQLLTKANYSFNEFYEQFNTFDRNFRLANSIKSEPLLNK